MNPRTPRVVPMAAALCSAAAAFAQPCQWTPLSATGPEARSGAKAVFDAQRGVVVLFGGTAAGSFRPETTWEWNGSSWALAAAMLPGGRMYHGMTYDPVRHVTLLFGGFIVGSNYSSDTWTY